MGSKRCLWLEFCANIKHFAPATTSFYTSVAMKAEFLSILGLFLTAQCIVGMPYGYFVAPYDDSMAEEMFFVMPSQHRMVKREIFDLIPAATGHHGHHGGGGGGGGAHEDVDYGANTDGHGAFNWWTSHPAGGGHGHGR